VGAVEPPGAPAEQSNAANWFAPSFLLEESKLRPPLSRPGTVRRTALLDRLGASPDPPVVSLAAPPRSLPEERTRFQLAALRPGA